MRRIGIVCAVLGLAGVAVSCSAVPLPEVTFFADGHTVNARPVHHCDPLLRDCASDDAAQATLKARAGKPIQISIPSELAKTPWLVNIQQRNGQGEIQPVEQKVFTDGDRLAYTAMPEAPDNHVVVVEIQQLGAVRLIDEAGQPAVDEAGQPAYEVRARAVWSLQVEPV